MFKQNGWSWNICMFIKHFASPLACSFIPWEACPAQFRRDGIAPSSLPGTIKLNDRVGLVAHTHLANGYDRILASPVTFLTFPDTSLVLHLIHNLRFIYKLKEQPNNNKKKDNIDSGLLRTAA